MERQSTDLFIKVLAVFFSTKLQCKARNASKADLQVCISLICPLLPVFGRTCKQARCIYFVSTAIPNKMHILKVFSPLCTKMASMNSKCHYLLTVYTMRKRKIFPLSVFSIINMYDNIQTIQFPGYTPILKIPFALSMQQFLPGDTGQLLPCYITADAHALASWEMKIFCPINQGDRNHSTAAEQGPGWRGSLSLGAAAPTAQTAFPKDSHVAQASCWAQVVNQLMLWSVRMRTFVILSCCSPKGSGSHAKISYWNLICLPVINITQKLLICLPTFRTAGWPVMTKKQSIILPRPAEDTQLRVFPITHGRLRNLSFPWAKTKNRAFTGGMGAYSWFASLFSD